MKLGGAADGYCGGYEKLRMRGGRWDTVAVVRDPCEARAHKVTGVEGGAMYTVIWPPG